MLDMLKQTGRCVPPPRRLPRLLATLGKHSLWTPLAPLTVPFVSLSPDPRPEMVVGWYHSHPGFGCWLSGVDVHTQQVRCASARVRLARRPETRSPYLVATPSPSPPEL